MFRKKEFNEMTFSAIESGPPPHADGMNSATVVETVYAKFLTHFVRQVVGDTSYADNIMKVAIPNWVTTTDEALAIVLVENCWEQEWDIYKNEKLSPDEFVRQNKNKAALSQEEWPISKKAKSCRYSNGGPGSKGSQGWSNEGIVRFNNLIKNIQGWRSSDNGKKIYEEILAHESALNEGKKNKRKHSALEDSEAIEVECNWEAV
jgi:hypothetical protein